MLNKTEGVVKNPFTTKPLSLETIENYKILLRLSKILNINVSTEIADITKEVSYIKNTELRMLSLFQYIDELGNYTKSQWFQSLNRFQLIKFIRELIDIWHYRANLDNDIKKCICPPNGVLISGTSNSMILSSQNINEFLIHRKSTAPYQTSCTAPDRRFS